MSDNLKYYQHAMMPNCKPHENADVSVFTYESLWKKEPWRRALFAKYTSEWDVEEVTGWYWCVKDSPFNLNEVKSKYRYEIRKGIENFDIQVIEPAEYIDGLYEVTVDALSQYPKAYREIPDKETFKKLIPTWKVPCFAAFDRARGVSLDTSIWLKERIYCISVDFVSERVVKHAL